MYWNSILRSNLLSFDNNNPSKILISGNSGYYSLSAYVNLNNNDWFDNFVWRKNGTIYLTNRILKEKAIIKEVKKSNLFLDMYE